MYKVVIIDDEPIIVEGISANEYRNTKLPIEKQR